MRMRAACVTVLNFRSCDLLSFVSALTFSLEETASFFAVLDAAVPSPTVGTGDDFRLVASFSTGEQERNWDPGRC